MATKPIYDFFNLKGIEPWPFQIEAWEAYVKGESGLINVPTGSGKTFAAFGGPIAEIIQNPSSGIQLLYITPLRSNANDIEKAISEIIALLNAPIRVEKRTGDISYTKKKKQKIKPPEIILTTPESLALMLTDRDMLAHLKNLKCIIVDEWHELLGNKRGVMLELALARLAYFSMPFRLWGMSATIGNLSEALLVLGGTHHCLKLITTQLTREVIVKTLLPPRFQDLPWTGHFGIRMLPVLLSKLELTQSTLLFTNTRAQAEKWFQGLQVLRPEWKALMAIHHSSIAQKERERVEEGLKDGSIRLVVCTSSLDLGVDFSSVEHVVQIGSPKSLSRLIQRAGRSNHRPFTPCQLLIVPVQVMELIELMGLRKNIEDREIEPRIPLKLCWDVLLQHMLSYACSGGFNKQDLFQQVRTTYAFSDLSESDFNWLISFLERGGQCLKAYPEFHKLVDVDGLYKVTDSKIVRLHRISVGTIPSSLTVQLQYMKGKKIGSIDEDFINRLQIGDAFMFGGKAYQLQSLSENIAYLKSVKKAEKVARWTGSRLPLSRLLSGSIRQILEEFSSFQSFPEWHFFQRALEIQERVSKIPKKHELLVEIAKSRQGHHLFFYLMESRTIHQTLGAILITRLNRLQKRSCTLSFNDYGIEVISNAPFVNIEKVFPSLFALDQFNEDLLEAVNLGELAKSTFRDIARIAQLVIQGFPGRRKALKQLHISTNLLYEVFTKYDPTNLLLEQAHREVRMHEIELNRLKSTFERLSSSSFLFSHTNKFSPFALPLYTESVSAHLSSESIEEIIANIQKSWLKPIKN